MGEQVEDQVNDVELSNAEVTFDNLTILKELSNIVNLVRNDDFLETVPKAKLKRVKWVPMFNCLKQGILDDMIQELNSMWEYEKMPEKLATLEKQKEKFGESNTDRPVWRPQLANVKAQLRAHDVANLLKQKKSLEVLAKEYETRVNKIKKTVSAKRGYLKALQLDILNYLKKNEDLHTKMSVRIENHSNLTKSIAPQINLEDISWTEKDMDINDGE